MKKIALSVVALTFAASAAHAQSASDPASGAVPPESSAPAPADPAAPSDPAADAAAQPGAPGADAGVTAGGTYSEQEIDSFAQATVKVQAIDADATIAAEQKQEKMAAAVAEAGLDPAKYNEIGKAAAADPELRTKIQTAMTKHAAPPQG